MISLIQFIEFFQTTWRTIQVVPQSLMNKTSITAFNYPITFRTTCFTSIVL